MPESHVRSRCVSWQVVETTTTLMIGMITKVQSVGSEQFLLLLSVQSPTSLRTWFRKRTSTGTESELTPKQTHKPKFATPTRE